MTLGALMCREDRVRHVSERLRDFKRKHGMADAFETKWVKVSPGKLQFYCDLIDFFFDDDDLRFRTIVIPDKSKLDHAKFSQTHDDWYYKMLYRLLELFVDPNEQYNIYLDIKDSRSAEKARRLGTVLLSAKHDYGGKSVQRVQNVRSHEVELIQLADLLIGAVGYINRKLTTSDAKSKLVERVRQRSGHSLTKTTTLGERKFNVFVWAAEID